MQTKTRGTASSWQWPWAVTWQDGERVQRQDRGRGANGPDIASRSVGIVARSQGSGQMEAPDPGYAESQTRKFGHPRTFSHNAGYPYSAEQSGNSTTGFPAFLFVFWINNVRVPAAGCACPWGLA